MGANLWIRHNFEKLSGASVGCIIVFDAALHILQFIKDGEHVDEFSKGQEVSLRRNKVTSILSTNNPRCGEICTKTVGSTSETKSFRFSSWLSRLTSEQNRSMALRWKYIKFISLFTCKQMIIQGVLTAKTCLQHSPLVPTLQQPSHKSPPYSAARLIWAGEWRGNSSARCRASPRVRGLFQQWTDSEILLQIWYTKVHM